MLAAVSFFGLLDPLPLEESDEELLSELFESDELVSELLFSDAADDDAAVALRAPRLSFL